MVPFEGTIVHRQLSSQTNPEGSEQAASGSGHTEAGGQTILKGEGDETSTKVFVKRKDTRRKPKTCCHSLDDIKL